MSLSSAEGHHAIDAEQGNEERLEGMDDEDEGFGRCGFDAIEHKDGLDGKVERTHAVGSGYDDRECAGDEGNKADGPAEVGCGRKGIEGQVEMKKITDPDAECVENEKGKVAHLAQRKHSSTHVAGHLANRSAHAEAAQQQPHEDEGDDQKAEGDEPSGRGKRVEPCTEVGAGAGKEVDEDGELEQQDGGSDDSQQQGIDDALGDDRTDGFGETDSVVACEHSAAAHLSDAGDDEAGHVGEKDCMNAGAAARMFAQRLEGLHPADTTQNHGRDSGNERDEHPAPRHVMEQGGANALEIEFAVHPPEQGAAKQDGQEGAE